MTLLSPSALSKFMVKLIVAALAGPKIRTKHAANDKNRSIIHPPFYQLYSSMGPCMQQIPGWGRKRNSPLFGALHTPTMHNVAAMARDLFLLAAIGLSLPSHL